MPKNKKKLKTGKLTASNVKNLSGDENSELNMDENASTISNASTNTSYQDLDSIDDPSMKGKQPDEILDKIDNLDSQLSTCLDGLLEKGFKEREEALKILKKIFSNKYIVDHLNNKIVTITDSLIRCLKKGKLNEQLLALETIMLLLVQIAYSANDSLTLLNELKPVLNDLIDDEKVDPEVRGACVKTLGLALFTVNESSQDMVGVLEKFESIFSNSYAKGDGTLRTLAPKVYDFHANTLSTWCLLLSIMPLHFVNKLAQKHVIHFIDFLKSPDVDMRIVAGETIALLSELAHLDPNSDISCFEDDELIEQLKLLANDSAKYRSKRDKKQQRSSFRDVLKTIEEGELSSQTIKFGSENLYIDNWIKRKQYETFKELLSTGLNTHLQENEFIREVFDLGMPIVSSDASRRSNLNSMNHTQRALFNREQFRNRTKSLNKKRENKGALNSTNSADFVEEEAND